MKQLLATIGVLTAFMFLQCGEAAPAAGSSSSDEQDINDRDNVTLVEGDIRLLPGQEYGLERTRNSATDKHYLGGPQHLVVNHSYYQWPNGVVPYQFDSSVSSDSFTVNAINAAIWELGNKTCIRLKPRTTEADYLIFKKLTGCWSYIGRTRGPQDISIGRGCESKGIVLHEIFHALGRWHEHSRPDRDNYVTIHFENIAQGREGNFELVQTSFITTLQGIKYDYHSIMHYRSTAFTKNGQVTISSKDPNVPNSALGQRVELSDLDLQHVRLQYNCPGGPTGGSWGAWSSWSGCSRACNTGTQMRNRTCVGGSACTGDSTEKRNCNTQRCPVLPTWSTWNAWSGCTATCGGGRQSRTRTCQNGNSCSGPNIEYRDCGTNACPQPPTWGSWGGWSDCSSTCRGGMRSRTRRCVNGNTCSGANIDYEECNKDTPCTPDPSNGAWGEWTTCSATCNTGTRTRSRNCGLSDPSKCQTQTEDCNTQACPDPLRGLRNLGCFAIPSVVQNLRLLENETPDLSDSATSRTKAVEKCGMGAIQFHYSAFSVALGFCISGSNNTNEYTQSPGFFCADGKGGLFDDAVYMDVYEIQNPQAYSDALHEVLFSTTIIRPTPTPTQVLKPPQINSSSFAALPSILSLCVALFVVFAIILF